jgi:hypothetical protein
MIAGSIDRDARVSWSCGRRSVNEPTSAVHQKLSRSRQVTGRASSDRSAEFATAMRGLATTIEGESLNRHADGGLSCAQRLLETRVPGRSPGQLEGQLGASCLIGVTVAGFCGRRSLPLRSSMSTLQ